MAVPGTPVRTGMATQCSVCSSKELDYDDKGFARCRTCGAETRPYWVKATYIVSTPHPAAEAVPRPPLMTAGEFGLPPRRSVSERYADYTARGISLLIAGFVLSWLPVLSLIGGVFSLVGVFLLLVGRKAFGPAHVKLVYIAFALWIAAVVGTYFLSSMPASAIAAANRSGAVPIVQANSVASAFRDYLLGMTVLGAVAGFNAVLWTYTLQGRVGRLLLLAGYTAHVVLLLATFASIGAALSGAVTTSVSGGAFRSQAFSDLIGDLSLFAMVYIVPAILYAIAYNMAANRIRLGQVQPVPLEPPESETPPAPA